ncbi:MAG: hypothetical protein ABSA30_09530 [Candidatus Aminicenantales bacterium]
MERELRRAGVYEPLSMLDPHALERALSGGTLDPALADRLEPFLKRERKITVTLSKVQDSL